MTNVELDAAIAEKVMGWRQHPHMADCWIGEDMVKRHPMVQPYRQKHYFTPSTDIATAWEVVEKMQTHDTVISRSGQPDAPTWHVRFGACDAHRQIWGVGATMPEAVCRAALAAAGEAGR